MLLVDITAGRRQQKKPAFLARQYRVRVRSLLTSYMWRLWILLNILPLLD